MQRLVQRVEAGDIPATELIVGGLVEATPEGAQLRKLGATVVAGVDAAVAIRKLGSSVDADGDCLP